MDGATQEELYKLAALGRERGLDRAVKWIMKHMADVERAARRRRRKRKVRLAQGSDFWIEEALLKKAAQDAILEGQ